MSTLTIDELFTPAVSGVTLDPNATPADGSWLEQVLTNAATLQLQTTAWQPGGPERTINAIMSVLFAQEDVVISIMAQGGFLDFAASGTVTAVAIDGTSVTTPVTPDPSIPGQNPTGAPGWLDVLASSAYDVTRIAAESAQGTIAIANTSAVPQGPFDVGTYHVANPVTGASYSNRTILTIAAKSLVGTAITGATNATPITVTTSASHGLSTGDVVQVAGVLGNTAANGIYSVVYVSATTFQLSGSVGNGSYSSGGTVNVCTTGTFAADVAGNGGSSAARTITETVTSIDGITCTNLAALFGSNWESNTALAARCRLRLQSLSPNGPHGAYEYFALSAIDILAAYDPAVILSQAVTRTLVQSSVLTGIVTLTVANADGAVSGASNLAVSGATNATPIEITTSTAHGLVTGNFATVSGVLDNTGANGTWTITRISSTKFTLDNSVGVAAYGGGGVVEGGDLGQIDRVIQNNCVPDDTTAITQSAADFPVAIVATVTLPQAYAASYATAISLAFATYFAGLAIGGSGGVIEYDNMVGVLYATAAGLGVLPGKMASSGLTLNAGTTDLSYPGSNYVATITATPPAITVVGV